MSTLIDRFSERGVFSALDRHFALTLARLRPSSDVAVLGAALASRAVQHGHVCADLRRLTTSALLDREEQPIVEPRLPELGEFRAALEASDFVGDGTRPTPLVLDAADRLYLYRYFRYERRLAAAIQSRASALEEVDVERLRAGVQRLFPRAQSSLGERQQRLATLVALLGRFAVISGGPGTGKTHTVAKMLVLMLELFDGNKEIRVALLAPTGKAKQRLAESIEKSARALIGDLPLPYEASTIHRVLGYQPRTPTRFRHDADNPLSYDVVIVDEASMVDLALMSKLVDAVPKHARLILLGDKDQLASVEAGAILGDIYADASGPYSAELARRIGEITGERLPSAQKVRKMRDRLVHLTESFRYPTNSGIAALARAVNAGDADLALATLRGRPIPPGRGQLSLDFSGQRAAAQSSDVALHEISDAAALARLIRPAVTIGFRALLDEMDVAKKLDRLGAFRVLCAHRRGDFGVDALNQLIEEALADAGLIRPDTDFYSGRPILVTQSDYQLELYNGDVGVLAESEGRLKAWFLGPKGELRRFSPARLPPHETVFAMTVHKSQGSEFERAFLILPPGPSPIVTRELVYTGLTRARQRIEIVATERVLSLAIAQRIERASGLSDALWSA